MSENVHESHIAPTPIEKLLAPVSKFIHQDTSSGLIMVAFMIIALVWANSPWVDAYDHFLHIPLTFGFGPWTITNSLSHWVNDGLMTVFFFLVGLEIKREFLAGELSTRQQAILPVIAAIGGMIAPALIYTFFNWGQPSMKGWAIPTATDIAFAMGVMSLLGKRVPLSLKIFLTALAIADDIGAIIIIAVFYAGEIHVMALLGAAVVLGILLWGNRMCVRSLLFYSFCTFLLWAFILQSGIHATLAGVMAAMTIPFRSYSSGKNFVSAARASLYNYESAFAQGDYELLIFPDGSEKVLYYGNDDPYRTLVNPASVDAIQDLKNYCTYVESPLRALEHNLHFWVAFLIVPLFTLCNAGIQINLENLNKAFIDPVTLGITFGLFLGKPIGILFTCFVFSKIGWVRIPKELTWIHILGAGSLAGIGFTMSLFVSNLSFASLPHILNDAKIGILVGSLLSVLCGLGILFQYSKRKKSTPKKPKISPYSD